jgi:hypothetical protein
VFISKQIGDFEDADQGRRVRLYNDSYDRNPNLLWLTRHEDYDPTSDVTFPSRPRTALTRPRSETGDELLHRVGGLDAELGHEHASVGLVRTEGRCKVAFSQMNTNQQPLCAFSKRVFLNSRQGRLQGLGTISLLE